MQNEKMMFQKIYDLINRDRKGMWASRIYDWYMLVMIVVTDFFNMVNNPQKVNRSVVPDSNVQIVEIDGLAVDLGYLIRIGSDKTGRWIVNMNNKKD